jgi:hypothetical protein
MSERGAQTNSNDERIFAGDHTLQILNRIEQKPESPWRQPAIYVAALALIVVLGGEWRRWVALDELRDKQHDYYNEVNVWEVDNFNRSKDIDAALKAQLGWDMDAKFGKLKPPPIPKGK